MKFLKHNLIIALAVAIILMLAACVNENLNFSGITPGTSGTDTETTVSGTETEDPSETTGEDGGFWLPTDEF